MMRYPLGALGLVGFLQAATVHGQVFVEDWQNRVIKEYTASGALINASLIRLPPGGGGGVGLTLDGNGHLFLADGQSGMVREYTTSGSPVNAALVSGLSWPLGLPLDGNGNFFVANGGIDHTPGSSIGEYTISGAIVNVPFIRYGFDTPKLASALFGFVKSYF